MDWCVGQWLLLIMVLLILRRAKREAAREVCGRFVRSHTWDREDPRLLVCEAQATPLDQSPSASFAALPHGPVSPSPFDKVGFPGCFKMHFFYIILINCGISLFSINVFDIYISY